MLTLIIVVVALVFLFTKIPQKFLHSQFLKKSQLFLQKYILYFFIINFFLVSITEVKSCIEKDSLKSDNVKKTDEINALKEDSEKKQEKIELLQKEELIIRDIYFRIEMTLKAKTRVGRCGTGIQMGRPKGIILLQKEYPDSDSIWFYKEKCFNTALDSVTFQSSSNYYPNNIQQFFGKPINSLEVYDGFSFELGRFGKGFIGEFHNGVLLKIMLFVNSKCVSEISCFVQLNEDTTKYLDCYDSNLNPIFIDIEERYLKLNEINP